MADSTSSAQLDLMTDLAFVLLSVAGGVILLITRDAGDWLDSWARAGCLQR
jgi:hypothetical protein